MLGMSAGLSESAYSIIKTKNEKSKDYCKADLRQRVLFFITIFDIWKLCSNGSRKGWTRLWPAGLNWHFGAETDLFNLQYRLLTRSSWNELTHLFNLLWCKSFYFKVPTYRNFLTPKILKKCDPILVTRFPRNPSGYWLHDWQEM